MTAEKVHLELLLGSQVHDSEGRRVGRILAVTAERDGDDCVVREFLLGPAALLQRLGITTLHIVGFKRREPLSIPWDQLDLSDPQRPRLRCRADELKARDNFVTLSRT